MTGADAKEVLLSGEPVELNGVTYQRMTAIIYERYRDGIAVSARLADSTGRSESIAPIRYINRIAPADQSDRPSQESEVSR